MDYLLTETGRSDLGALLTVRSLYAFDFDGTLAKIVRDHHAARLARPIRFWLEKLTKRAPTAIISGRSVEDLRSFFNDTATTEIYTLPYTTLSDRKSTRLNSSHD